MQSTLAGPRFSFSYELKDLRDLDGTRREITVGQLMILAGLRGLEETVEKEIRNVPILKDIMEHKVLGREYRRGEAAGEEKGVRMGELAVLRRLMRERFGDIPASIETFLEGQSAADLEKLSVRLLKADRIEDLLI